MENEDEIVRKISELQTINSDEDKARYKVVTALVLKIALILVCVWAGYYIYVKNAKK